MDTLNTIVDTWPSVVKHIFDSVWGVVGTAMGGILAGWLLLKRPAVMDRFFPTKKGEEPQAP